jgi:hypothetical protein
MRALAGAALALYCSASGVHALPGVPDVPLTMHKQDRAGQAEEPFDVRKLTFSAEIPDVPVGSDLYNLLHDPAMNDAGRTDAAPRDHSPR